MSLQTFSNCAVNQLNISSKSSQTYGPSTCNEFDSVDMFDAGVPVKIKLISSLKIETLSVNNVLDVEKRLHMGLLLVEDNSKYHYCLITNFQRFIRLQAIKESVVLLQLSMR